QGRAHSLLKPLVLRLLFKPPSTSPTRVHRTSSDISAKTKPHSPIIPPAVLENNTPTLINLPPPPSDTPTDQGPGTPNSGTTSLSALSVVAVKDGHQGHILSHGHGHGHHHP